MWRSMTAFRLAASIMLRLHRIYRTMSSALSNLVDQRSRFLSFVLRRVKDRTTAEDILQLAYIRALSHADHLNAAESAEAWFFRILRNAVIDHYRHHAVETRTFESLEPGIEPPSPAPDPAPSNLCQCVAGALHEIQPAYQEILREVDLAEVPLESFAQQAGITRGNAAVRAHRAHRSLRKKLLDHCGACAEAGCLDCSCRQPAVAAQK